MEEKTTSLKKTARIAGLLYLLLAITGAYSIIYVPSKIMVRGDAVATANNILANEFLFRTGIISDIISSTIFVFLVFVLYRLFKQVNERQAKLMVALVIAQIPAVFIMEAFNITSLMILKGEILKTFELTQRQDLAMLFLKINDYGVLTLEIFWGLWLFPLALLVYRSRFLPRFLIVRQPCAFVSQYTFVCYAIAEISMILWLLIKSVKAQESASFQANN